MIDWNMVSEYLSSDRGTRAWIIFRHAERGPLYPGSSCPQTPLTREGMSSSRNYGKEARSCGIRLGYFCTSPVLRCVETSKHFLAGYGDGIEVVQKEVMAYPGDFLVDGAMPKGHVLSPAVHNLLSSIMTIDIPEGMAGVFVSHDAVIAPILTFLLDMTFDQDNKIDFLDGMVLLNTKGRWLALDHQNRQHEVTEEMRAIAKCRS